MRSFTASTRSSTSISSCWLSKYLLSLAPVFGVFWSILPFHYWFSAASIQPPGWKLFFRKRSRIACFSFYHPFLSLPSEAFFLLKYNMNNIHHPFHKHKKAKYPFLSILDLLNKPHLLPFSFFVFMEIAPSSSILFFETWRSLRNQLTPREIVSDSFLLTVFHHCPKLFIYKVWNKHWNFWHVRNEKQSNNWNKDKF